MYTVYILENAAGLVRWVGQTRRGNFRIGDSIRYTTRLTGEDIRLRESYAVETLEEALLLESEKIREHRKTCINKADRGSVHQHTVEVKLKMSLAAKGRPSAFKGRTHTEKAKKKVSDANKGRSVSDATRKKMSEAYKGWSNPTEVCKKISEKAKQQFADPVKKERHRLATIESGKARKARRLAKMQQLTLENRK